MAIGSDGYEIIGVSLFGPPPLEQIHLSIDAGLFTLFGPSGAGKSSVLEGVLDALQGRRRAKSHAYVHVRLTGLALNTDPEKVSRFEHSLREGLSIDRTEVYGRTRQKLWNGVLAAISGRAEVEVPPVGDSMVISLAAKGTEGHPRWDVFYCEPLDDEEWARVDALANRQRSLMDWARRHVRDGEGLPDGVLDEFFQPLGVPFLEDSPMWENVPLVASLEKGGQLNFWPKYWPVPQLWLGSLTISPVDILTDGASAGWIREATGKKLIDMASGTKSFINVVDEETEFDPAFEKDVQVIEARANEFFSLMGYPHYRLSMDLKTPKAWFVGETPEWKVTTIHPSNGDKTFDLTDLSTAEQKWGVAAVQWALAGAGDDNRPRALLIDEPERGLHRLREKDLPHALSQLCMKDPHLTVLTASHAPAFLDLRTNSEILRTTRAPGFPTSVTVIDSTVQGPLSMVSEQFGLTPGDVLQLTRVFVLVEGDHDEIVLGHLLADELGKASAQILALRGAKDLRSVAEAKFLFSSTEAMFLVVLDGLLMEKVRPIWDEAQGHANAGSIKDARRALGKLKHVEGGGELKWLEELGHAALNTAKIARIEVHGLEARDIVMYLPEGHFMNTSKTWAQLDREYEEYS